MRSCRHCAHENADHLAFCSQCGRKLPRTDGPLAVERLASDPTGYSRTILATPFPVSTTGRSTVSGGRVLSERNLAAMSASRLDAAPATPPSRVRWLGESVGYIYVYLRGKLDAGERRRRLVEERSGAETLLAGALNELGQVVLREGVQHA